MSTRNWTPKEITSPRGAWSASALVRKGNPSRGTATSNVRFLPGEVYSREGTSAVQVVNSKVTSMYNWLSPTANLLLYQEGSNLRLQNLAGGSASTLQALSGSPRAVSCADLATRLYYTAFSTTGVGTQQARVWDGSSASADLCFRGPLAVSSFSATDSGTGLCTKGKHRIGFVFQSRSGFSGKFSPVVAEIFTPTSVTLNAGNRTITVSVTLDTPVDAGPGSGFFPIMSRSDNDNEFYFIPEGFYIPDPIILPATASAWAFTFTISISDGDLADRATVADGQQNLLTATSTGSGPFTPNFVVAYGRRMGYGVGAKVYFSGINDAQSISEDQSVVQTQNQRKIAAGFPIGQSFYLTGDKWTARTQDNGDVPATWPQPTTVSDSLGAPFLNCVEWKTAGSYAWIAAEAGLYIFDGNYPSMPITYFRSDAWQRINWNAAYAIQIADDTINLKCHVAVPLDGATEPSHDIVIDYTNGLTYETCDISLDNFDVATFSSIRMVKEFATSRTALWIGPSAAGNIVHLDPTTHNDNGSAIHAIWRTGYMREGELPSKTVRVGNADLWIRGNGTLIQTWEGLDADLSVTPVLMSAGNVPSTLSAAPGQEYYSKFDLSPVENFVCQIETNAVDDWFALSGLRAYMKPRLYTR